MAFIGHGLWVRLRVDTPVTAVVPSGRGCVAEFTDPSGERQVVDLTGLRGGCGAGNPGEERTVWYDASDPSVNAPTDGWWVHAALLASGVLTMVVVLVSDRRARTRRTAATPAPPFPPAPVRERPMGRRDVADRLEVLADGARALGDGPPYAPVAELLVRARTAWLAEDDATAELRCREATRLVLDEWPDDTVVGRRVVGLTHTVFG